MIWVKNSSILIERLHLDLGFCFQLIINLSLTSLFGGLSCSTKTESPPTSWSLTLTGSFEIMLRRTLSAWVRLNEDDVPLRKKNVMM